MERMIPAGVKRRLTQRKEDRRSYANNAVATRGGTEKMPRGGLQSNQTHPTDLASTLNQFGHPGFDVEAYVKKFYETHPVSVAPDHHRELIDRKNITSRALKTYVMDHYQYFIESSKEIHQLESDMSQLHDHLLDYRTMLKKMAELSSAGFDKGDVILEESKEEFMQKKNIEQDIQETKDMILDLDNSILEKQFEIAMNLIDNIKERIDQFNDVQLTIELSESLEHHTKRLTDILSTELQSFQLNTMERRRYTVFLSSLGKASESVQFFLKSRSERLRIETQSVSLQGDLSLFFEEISALLASSILSTGFEFRKLFPDSVSFSSVVVWASEEVKLFGDLFCQHVFHMEIPMEKIRECTDSAYKSFSSLESSGVNLTFLFSRIISSGIEALLKSQMSRIKAQVAKKIPGEAWVTEILGMRLQRVRLRSSEDRVVQSQYLKLTESGKVLYSMVELFLKDVKCLKEIQHFHSIARHLYLPVSSGLIKCIEEYIWLMKQRLQDEKQEKLSDDQFVGLLCNAYYLADDLVPRVKDVLKDVFQTDPIDVATLRNNLQLYFDIHRDFFCQKNAPHWIRSVVDWKISGAQRYAMEEPGFSDAFSAPLKGMVDLIELFGLLRLKVEQDMNSVIAKQIIEKSVEEILKLLTSDVCWKHCPVISSSGVHLFALDLKFFMKGVERFANSSSLKLADECVSSVVDRFMSQSGKEGKNLSLKTDREYDLVIEQFIRDNDLKLVKDYVSTIGSNREDSIVEENALDEWYQIDEDRKIN